MPGLERLVPRREAVSCPDVIRTSDEGRGLRDATQEEPPRLRRRISSGDDNIRGLNKESYMTAHCSHSQPAADLSPHSRPKGSWLAAAGVRGVVPNAARAASAPMFKTAEPGFITVATVPAPP